MAGLWPLSLQQRIDINGKPYVGARAYFYEAETTTPLNTYQNYDLSVRSPNPVTADGYGMFPAVYLDEDDKFYRVRVTTAGGVVLFDQTTLPIYGPTSGGGGGGGGGTPVDPYSLLQTGDLKHRFGIGVHPGWERCNGRTIGDSTSGATGRANADTQALFEFLWGAVPNTILAVNGGRGASAAADFAAHKTIQLPDLRGRVLAGLDDMGTSAADRLNVAIVSTGSPTQLGSSGGEDRHTLATAEIPVHNHTGNTTSSGAHKHSINYNGAHGQFSVDRSSDPRWSWGDATHTNNTNNASTNTDGAHSHPFTTDNAGGGGAHNNMPPFGLASIYIKL